MSDTAKKGILVVSFGTSHEDTRAVTIDAIEKEIGAAPELKREIIFTMTMWQKQWSV